MGVAAAAAIRSAATLEASNTECSAVVPGSDFCTQQWGMPPPSVDSPDAYVLGVDELVPVFLDEHRQMLDESLDGLTDDEVRRQLVVSTTTLLGLVKHATFVERVWFEEAVTGQPRAELGIVAGPDESFVLDETDTIESVRSSFRSACQHSREIVAELGPDAVVAGNRRGALPLRWIVIHVLRELAQHCGHADIIREQVLAARAVGSAQGGGRA